MKRLLIIILSLTVYDCFGQVKKYDIKEGIYTGGICRDGAICGFWLLKPDASFVFVNIEQGFIKSFGTGNWQLLDSGLVKCNFNADTIPIPDVIQAEYRAVTKPSYDSVYISGQLKNDKGEAIRYAAIIYNEQFDGISDSNGNFKAAFPIRNNITRLRLLHKIGGYKIITYYLLPNANVHRLNLTLSNAPQVTVEQLSPADSITLRVDTSSSGKRVIGTLSLVTDDRNLLITWLLKAKEKQPLLTAGIHELIERIRK